MKKAEALSLLASLHGSLNGMLRHVEEMKSHTPHEPNDKCQDYIRHINASARQLSRIMDEWTDLVQNAASTNDDKDEVDLKHVIGTRLIPLTQGRQSIA